MRTERGDGKRRKRKWSCSRSRSWDKDWWVSRLSWWRTLRTLSKNNCSKLLTMRIENWMPFYQRNRKMTRVNKLGFSTRFPKKLESLASNSIRSPSSKGRLTLSWRLQGHRYSKNTTMTLSTFCPTRIRSPTSSVGSRRGWTRGKPKKKVRLRTSSALRRSKPTSEDSNRGNMRGTGITSGT